MRSCSQCKRELPFEAFPRNDKDGACKNCLRSVKGFNWPKIPPHLMDAAKRAGAKDAMRVASGIEKAVYGGMPVSDALDLLFSWQPELRWRHRK